MAHFFISSLLLFVFLIYFFPSVYSSPNELFADGSECSSPALGCAQSELPLLGLVVSVEKDMA